MAQINAGNTVRQVCVDYYHPIKNWLCSPTGMHLRGRI
jgi:hypothetical protein